jgi:hypothetical protein
MACVFTAEECKAAGEKVPYAFNWTLQLARKWEVNAPYAADVKVRPSTEALQTGFEYSSSGGQSNGASEPRWPTRLGGTVRDGSITWTAEALTVNSLLETIASSVWDVPTGLTGTGEVTTSTAGQQATEVVIADGTPGQVYEVVNEITTSSGNEYQAVLELTIDA